MKKDFNEIKETRSAKLIAFKKALESGTFESLSLKILHYAKQYRTFNIFDIVDQYESYNYSSVTAVISFLEDIGLIKKIGTEIHMRGATTHEMSLFSMIESPGDQFLHAYNRRMAKFHAWIKRGNTEFKDLLPETKLGQLDIFKDA